MKRKRTVSIILVLCLMVGSLNFFAFNMRDKMKEVYTLLGKDHDIAKSLADITGKSANSLIELKAQNKDWNGVIEKIEDVQKNSGMLNNEFEKLIESGGYLSEEVREAKLIVEQLIFNLEEIISELSFEKGANGVLYDEGKSYYKNLELYKKIEQGFDKNLAVYLALELKKDLGSIEDVINEYIFCLQIDVDLRLYLTDKDKYEKEVAEKSVWLMREEAITIDDISTFVIKSMKFNETPNIQSEMGETDKNNIIKSYGDIVMGNSPVDPIPQNPTEEIMKHIDEINQAWRQ